MNKLHGTITGGAAGLIIGIIGLLLLRVEYGPTRAAHTPVMEILTIVLLIIGAVIGYLMLGKTTKPPTIAQPSRIMSKRRIIAEIALGIIVGAVLASFGIGGTLIYIEAHTMETTVNGWSTTLNNGEWGNNILLRAAFAQVLPAANVPAEAVYWTATVDSTGAKLNGTHVYILHFPAGGLPPNNAFWSLTMTNLQAYMVNNSINRYNVGTFSNLTSNADGSVDIYLQNTPPSGNESNWLPAPSGDFKLWLRAYLPGPAILNGSYQVPPVVEVS
jgi:hypothetical protein